MGQLMESVRITFVLIAYKLSLVDTYLSKLRQQNLLKDKELCHQIYMLHIDIQLQLL